SAVERRTVRPAHGRGTHYDRPRSRRRLLVLRWPRHRPAGGIGAGPSHRAGLAGEDLAGGGVLHRAVRTRSGWQRHEARVRSRRLPGRHPRTPRCGLARELLGAAEAAARTVAMKAWPGCDRWTLP